MYTINHMWIDNADGIIQEARSQVSGVYETLEAAQLGLHDWFMNVPNNGCEIKKLTEEQYSFLSPDKKTRGFVEIQQIKELDKAL